MNFIKRGFVSIVRRPGKSLILLVLIFILGNVIAGAISVKDAIRNTQEVMNEKIGVICRIALDEKQLNTESSKSRATSKASSDKADPSINPIKIESLTAAIVDSIGQSQYLRYYDYFSSIWLEGIGMSNYVDENASSGYDMKPAISSAGSSTTGETTVQFQFSGGQNPKISDFEQGKATLYQGRVFTAEEMVSNANVVLVSKNLAVKNALSVGSTIKFKRDIYRYLSADGNKKIQPEIGKTLSYEFTVIGIFEPKKNTVVGEDGKLQVVASPLENVIYATNKAISNCDTQISEADKEVNNTETSSYYSSIDPIFVLKNPGDLEAFVNESKSKLPQYYKMTDNSSQFKTVSSPMTNMGWIAGVVLYVAIGATLLILSLLITLFLRDRKHEMGIYLSLGERKIKVASQIIIEVMMIAVIGVSLSLFTGNIIAKNMSEQMLENQIIADQQNGDAANGGIAIDMKESYYYGTNSRDSISSQDLIDSYKVTLDSSTILLFYLCGLGSVLLSTLVPIIYTLRLNPKKILM